MENYNNCNFQKVDYKGLEECEDFGKYVSLTKELVRLQVEELTREQKLAFFINIYNALVIHAFIVRGPPSNMWQRYKVPLPAISNDLKLHLEA